MQSSESHVYEAVKQKKNRSQHGVSRAVTVWLVLFFISKKSGNIKSFSQLCVLNIAENTLLVHLYDIVLL